MPQTVDRQQGKKVSNRHGGFLQLHQVLMRDLQRALPEDGYPKQQQLQPRDDHDRQA